MLDSSQNSLTCWPRFITTGGDSELAILEVTWWLLLLAYEVAGFSGDYSDLATACTVI